MIFRPLPPLRTPTPPKRWLGLGYAFIFAVFVVCGLLTGILLYWASELPSLQQLEKIQPNLITRIFSADSVLLKEYFIERRFAVPFERFPKHLVNAVIAAEDRHFYRHWGVHLKRIFGAFLQDIKALRLKQGASTITQQLARNLFLGFEKTWVRKIKEAMTAVQIEKRYTKNEIMEYYLNQIYVGAGVYGLQAASRKYFGKDVSDLSIAESALLAGALTRPEAFRPDRKKNHKRARTRRNWVLRSMRDLGTISAHECRQSMREPIRIDTTRKKARSHAPYFTETIRRYLERKYGSKVLYSGGLTVRSTVHYAYQKELEDSVRVKLAKIQRPINKDYALRYRLARKMKMPLDTLVPLLDSLVGRDAGNLKKKGWVPDSAQNLRIVQTALVALDTKTGAIHSMIGGRSFRESEFNRVTQGLRQPGSAFKPMVYATAIDSGFTAASVIDDQPVSLDMPTGVWRPENYNLKFSGQVTLRKSLERSINIAAIHLMKTLRPYATIRLARKMGFAHPLSPVLALAIGVCEVTPLEITSAYSVFPNGGIQAKPHFIQKIVGPDGTVLEQHQLLQDKVMDARTAYVMTDMLRTVVRRGTGYGSRFPGGFLRDAGGKTGTTNDYTDAWFVGFTPQITCGVWVGIDSKLTLGHGQAGSKAALPIWTAYMKIAHRELPKEEFERPSGIVEHVVCAESGLLAKPSCPKFAEEIFIQGKEPRGDCDIDHFKESRKAEPGRRKPRNLF